MATSNSNPGDVLDKRRYRPSGFQGSDLSGAGFNRYMPHTSSGCSPQRQLFVACSDDRQQACREQESSVEPGERPIKVSI